MAVFGAGLDLGLALLLAAALLAYAKAKVNANALTLTTTGAVLYVLAGVLSTVTLEGAAAVVNGVNALGAIASVVGLVWAAYSVARGIKTKR